MLWKQLFGKKSLETLNAEAKGEKRLLRVLGPIALTSLGVGAIVGPGIFVMTGRTAAVDAGPAVMLFLPPLTWLRLVGWLALGLLIYFGYGLRHSTLGRQRRGQVPMSGTAAAVNGDGVKEKSPHPAPACATR